MSAVVVRFTVVILSWVFLSGTTYAQSVVQRDLYSGFTRVQGDQIALCVQQGSPTAELDTAIARAVAETLLIDVVVYEVDWAVPALTTSDFQERVFIALADHCEGIMSYNLSATAVPEWLTVSRVYYLAPYVLLVAVDHPIRELSELPPGSVIGSQLYSVADYRLIAYNQSLPESRRWTRHPYTSGTMLLGHLLEARVDAALVYGPSVMALSDDESSRVREVSPSPLSFEAVPLGFAMMAENSFLRTLIDDAILELLDNGTLAGLIQELGLPGQPGETR